MYRRKLLRATVALILMLLPLNFALAKPISALDALRKIESQITKPTLSGTEIDHLAEQISESMPTIASDKRLLAKAFEVVATYESSPYGALFVGEATRKGLVRKQREGQELHYAIATIEQGLIDHTYTSEKLSQYSSILSNTKFKSSDVFPGAVAPPKDPKQSYIAKIDASNTKSWGSPTSNEKRDARRPTGCYLAAGSIARIKVPSSMVNKGFSIRVGAHSWSHDKKPIMKRLDRVSILYPITKQETLIGSPLGGGIYIEVPYLSEVGVVEVEIQNAVRAPYFSARSFDRMTNGEWRVSQRQNPGAWADFESDKFMMQVPSSWVRQYDNPESLMADWDRAMDVIFSLRGLNPEEFNKTLLYLQVDVQMRGAANFPGYPQANYAYDPHKNPNSYKNHWMLRGASAANWSVFHELGHSILITKFRGETEALVNFMHVAVQNRAFGRDLDEAFGESVSGMSHISIDEAAVMWMVTETFRRGEEMNHSNKPGDEFKYQHRGHAKYADIVRLYGWEALDNFWHAANEDYMGAKSYYPKSQNNDPVDSRILHLSLAVGEEITPLIHFWGIHPQNPEKLRTEIAAAGLKPSTKIRELLSRYSTLIPRNAEEFLSHTQRVYPKGLKSKKKSNPMYGEGWYEVWQERYNEECHKRATESLDRIIGLYFNN